MISLWRRIEFPVAQHLAVFGGFSSMRLDLFRHEPCQILLRDAWQQQQSSKDARLPDTYKDGYG